MTLGHGTMMKKYRSRMFYDYNRRLLLPSTTYLRVSKILLVNTATPLRRILFSIETPPCIL